MDFKEGYAIEQAEAARSGVRAYVEDASDIPSDEDYGVDEFPDEAEDTDHAAALFSFEMLLIEALTDYCERSGLPLLDRRSSDSGPLEYIRAVDSPDKNES